MQMDSSTIRRAAGVSGAIGVVVGAFGAHALKDLLTQKGTLVSSRAVIAQLDNMNIQGLISNRVSLRNGS